MNIDKIFSDKIDCTLNYHNIVEIVRLFEESKLISDISVFRFLEELFNVPIWKTKSIVVSKNIEYILNYVDKRFHHPLKEIVFNAGMSKLQCKDLPVKRALIYMKKAKKFNGYYSALNIIEYSSRRGSNYYMVNNLYNLIIKQWNND